MAGKDDPLTVTQRSADSLALALEGVGFDVGLTFPDLQDTCDGMIEIGDVQATVATQLALVLSRAANAGIAL